MGSGYGVLGSRLLSGLEYGVGVEDRDDLMDREGDHGDHVEGDREEGIRVEGEDHEGDDHDQVKEVHHEVGDHGDDESVPVDRRKATILSSPLHPLLRDHDHGEGEDHHDSWVGKGEVRRKHLHRRPQ